MRCTATGTEEPSDRSSRLDPSRFEPRDLPAASREEALRLAREAQALPEVERWAYIRTVRAVARREGLAGMEKLELLHPAPLAEVDLPDPAVLRELDLQPASVAQGLDLQPTPVVPHVRSRKRGLRAFAFTGAVVGMAVALLLPPSLSERLPGTSGNDRAPLAAQPPASTGAKASSRAARRAHPPPVARRGKGQSGVAGQRRLTSGKIVTGSGDQPIGTIRVDRPMRLVWAFEGKPSSIVSSAWSLHPRSDRGTTVLTPGTYRRFGVRSTARWTIRLVPADEVR